MVYINVNQMLITFEYKKSFWFVSFSMFDISSWDTCGLALVDTWRFSKSTWSLDRLVIWKSRWGPFFLTHNSTKFNGHWRCEMVIGDAPFYEYNVITWQMSHVTRWLWSTQIKSHLAKIGDHCPSEGGDRAFFAYHMIIWLISHVTRWVRYPHPKSQRF